jgi:hypothetical protein
VLSRRDFHFVEIPWFSGVHGRHNALNMGLDQPPSALSEHDYSDFAGGEILLIAKVLIGRQQDLKPGCLGSAQQFPIFQLVPTACTSFDYYVPGD